MPHVNVALASGRHVNLSVSESCKVQDLKILVQKVFGQGFVKLVTAEGRVLTQPGKSLDAVGIQDGDRLTASAQQAKLAAGDAFALWCCGAGDSGGKIFSVQERLINVQQVQATHDAFAALLADGSVVTWGDPESGGDSSEAQPRLRHVQKIQATAAAFAELLADLLLHGEMLTGAAAALKSKLSSKTCSRLRLQMALLLRCWQMDLVLHGECQAQVGTASPSSTPKCAAD